MSAMNLEHTTRMEPEAEPPAARWQSLVNWLALLMLLAVGVVWH